MNNLMLVGRLVSKRDDRITLAVPRSYKNSEGIYETDFFDVELWGEMARNVMEYCRQGDLIGIRGRLEGIKQDDGDGHTVYKAKIIAEKVSFLSSKHANM